MSPCGALTHATANHRNVFLPCFWALPIIYVFIYFEKQQPCPLQTPLSYNLFTSNNIEAEQKLSFSISAYGVISKIEQKFIFGCV